MDWLIQHLSSLFSIIVGAYFFFFGVNKTRGAIRAGDSRKQKVGIVLIVCSLVVIAMGALKMILRMTTSIRL